MVEKTIEKVGLSSRCALALCTDLPVAATEEDRDLTLRVLEAGSRQVIAAGAEVIVLGCAGMSGLDGALAERLGMPVIDSPLRLIFSESTPYLANMRTQRRISSARVVAFALPRM
jgi:Asp/Glu/hydantoin racemase